MSGLRVPVATYRLQFNRQFHFEDARNLVPYLYRLGVSDLYASPILKARSGSLHGYDVTDPSQLNPELGRAEEFEALVQTLQQHGMGLLLDIVPNHMAVSPENQWWADLLENGLCSPYAAFFDIDWGPADNAVKNRILLPILGNPYHQELENQEITLTMGDTGLSIRYHVHRLPLDVKFYRLVFSHRLNTLETALGGGQSDFRQLKELLDVMEHLPACTSLDLVETGKHYRERQAIKKGLWHIVNTSPKVKAFLLENIAHFNGKKGESRSFTLLNHLLEQQVYQLAFWKTAYKEINYRRFFDINELIGIRVEEPEVFEAAHALICRLVQQGKVTGLRIDHIDGLYDPVQYLSQLQHYIVPEIKETSWLPGFYIIVEKILSGNEALPQEWPVLGTTGYEFLNMVNAIFVDSKGIEKLQKIYSQFTGSKAVFSDIVYDKKKQVMKELFPAEVNALGQCLANLAQQFSHTTSLSTEELKEALVEVSACLPVYRTYIRTLEVPSRDCVYLECAFREAHRRNHAVKAALDFLRSVLLLDFPAAIDPEQKETWLKFVLRWQQLTGAIMAKGFEDTALYTYNRLVSLNEVGGAPDSSGLPVDEFHRLNLVRSEHWPHTLSATSTHDTKRGEDVRARINVLSELPDEWGKHLAQWNRWNQPKKQLLDGLPVPEPNMEMLLYQTLVGACPLFRKEIPRFRERLKAYAVKAAREAKAFTSWLSPNPEYESALVVFLESILENSDNNNFLKDFLLFGRQVAYYGALNSLAQVLLKITSPGVPDFYQGTELWDFSLVDPDNRRPVYFKKRMQLLEDIIKQKKQGQQSLAQQILSTWEDGQVKLYTIYKALNVRRAYQDLFLDGQYIPLQVAGQKQEHICAFMRCKGSEWVLVVVPRLLAKLVRAGTLPVGRRVWGDDLLLLPEGTPERWLNVFTGEKVKLSGAGQGLALADIMSIFPVALLTGI